MNVKKVNKILEKIGKDYELDFEIKNEINEDGENVISCYDSFTIDDYKISSCFFHTYVNCDDGYAGVSISFECEMNMNMDSYKILNDINENLFHKFTIDSEDGSLVLEYSMYASDEEQIDETIRGTFSYFLDKEYIDSINELLSYAK